MSKTGEFTLLFIPHYVKLVRIGPDMKGRNEEHRMGRVCQLSETLKASYVNPSLRAFKVEDDESTVSSQKWESNVLPNTSGAEDSKNVERTLIELHYIQMKRPNYICIAT